MTTTDELRDILNWPLMKSLQRQVCAKDELPVGKKPSQAKAFIVNTDLARDPGQHWVALYFKGNKSIYFDSYGLPPLKDHILPFIQKNSLGWIENTQMLQDVTSEVCGLYNGAQLIIFFCFRFSVVLFDRPGISIRLAAHCVCRVLVFASS